MQLLDEVLHVSGGLAEWRRLRRFTIHLSIRGSLFSRIRRPVSMKEMVVSGDVHAQALEMTGFTASDRRALYRPERVALERADGELLAEQHASPNEFRELLKADTWDELLLTFFCGSLIRSYLDIPFVLAEADFVTNKVGMSTDRGEWLRALHVRFPERLGIHMLESTLYFDDQARLRRHEYPSLHENDSHVVQVHAGHQRYGEILVPTLCELAPVQHEASMSTARPSLVDIEIFDATFE